MGELEYYTGAECETLQYVVKTFISIADTNVDMFRWKWLVNVLFWGYFPESRKAPITFVISVCSPHVSSWHPLDGNLIFGTSTKSCRETLNVAKSGKKFALILSTFCRKSILLRHSVLLCCWQWHAPQELTQNAMLRFRCNNGYVIAPLLRYADTATLLLPKNKMTSASWNAPSNKTW